MLYTLLITGSTYFDFVFYSKINLKVPNERPKSVVVNKLIFIKVSTFLTLLKTRIHT